MQHAGLRWDEIADGAWRVCDPARSASDAEAVIAYVERGADGAFEVVWLCGTPGTQTFVSLDDAERAVTARYAASRRDGSPLSTKPVPIAHRPPLSTA